MADIKGRWWKIEDKKERIIQATFDPYKEFVMDPKGYFLIKFDSETKTLHAGYCTADNKLVAEVVGKTAEEVYNTIIREGFISRIEHAAYLGKELEKAEIAMKLGKKYVQDDPLDV